LQMKEKLPTIEVIIAGSTYNQDDKELYKRLVDEGIRIFSEYIPRMEDIYNLADFYIFPVLREDGAIETPLSVLEAMACNLPVITTRFGSLPDTFKEDEYFHYVHSSEEIVAIIKNMKKGNCNNREKIKPYTWKQIARQLVDIIE
jgi:glycosyltransferase involved in cell wall biosynthesis